ncbi:hypothetical protein BGX31_010423 [Mortierella sp. GBA43]|nr:hypothetical protein BGX31_010423 [Mortierella sp. GBA43]
MAAKKSLRSNLAADLNDLFKDLQSPQVKVVGNYHLGQVIGQGTYGKVKLATHTLTGQQVAVKIIAKTHASIITREIYHWRCLSHPNIAHLHEVLTTETKIYLVTEYCPNGELLEALIKDGRCKPSLAKRWFRQICLAIQYCHAQKIVHRDLKLENILLDSQNNIKLIDFGFTRECESKKLLESYCGSAAYTAPEIIVGKKYSGQEADIWSLGVILYTLLAGYLPFDDDNEAVVQDKIVELDYELPTELFCQDAQDLIKSILKEEPKERFSIEQILSHPWWTPRTDDDAEGADGGAADQDPDIGIPYHGRQGSLTKREVHPVQSVQAHVQDIFPGTASPQLASPLLASPIAQHPYGPFGHQSPFTFNTGGSLGASIPGGPAAPSPLGSPLPSPSPLTGKGFPRFDIAPDGSPISRSASAGGFPANAFEQKLLRALTKLGFDQEIFTKGVPAQSCDPGYGLWCLLVDQVKQRAIDNGTTLEWEQNIAFMDPVTVVNPSVSPILAENGKRSPRPMSDPSPSSSQTNLSLTQATLIQQQQQQHADLQQQTIDLKLQLDQYKLETELLKMEKELLEKDKRRLADANRARHIEAKELPPIVTQTASGQSSSIMEPSLTPRAERPGQDSGASISTSSTPHTSWELPEREGPAVPNERPRRKSKGILHSLKDRFFSGGGSDVESNHSGSPYPPSPIPPKHLAGSTISASSSTNSTTTYATPKPLPAPPAHPYPQFLQQQVAAQSPLSAVTCKSASTSSLVVETGHGSSAAAAIRAAMSSDNLAGDHLEDPDAVPTTPQKPKGFMAWITESASGTVLNKSPVAQSAAKVPKRINGRSYSNAEAISISSSTTSPVEETRPQIPAIPASFFQPIWKSPTNSHSSTSLQSNGGSSSSLLATSAPSSTTMSFRQRLASFSSSSAKITPEERQRAAAAAAAAAALVAQPALPERARSPSPPSSPRGPGGAGSLGNLGSPKPKIDTERQSEINDIVAAAVAATASAHLKSSGSRKKKSKASDKSSRSSNHSNSNTPPSSASTTATTTSFDQRSSQDEHGQSVPSSPKPPTLQIPSPTTGSKDLLPSPSKESPRKPSIKSSKASMPSLMIAFSSFKPSKSAPSSPLVQQPIQLPEGQSPVTESPKRRSHTRSSKDGKGLRYEDIVNQVSTPVKQPSDDVVILDTIVNTTPSESKNVTPTKDMAPTYDSAEVVMVTKERRSSKYSADRPIPVRAFSDGVVLQDEARPKKRTTSRTSITAASLGRKSNESVASCLERPEQQPVPHPPSGVAPSKRASLGSMSSRRSSSSSMRDRNIYGLTLDSGTLSRTSSLNHNRTPLNKSTFQSPGGSPAHARERSSHRNSVSRTSHEESPAVPRVSVSVTVEDKHRASGERQRRSRTSQDLPDIPYRENSAAGESSHSKRSSGALDMDIKVNAALAAASATTTTISMTRVRLDEAGPSTAPVTGSKIDDALFNSETSRADFADGRGPIPSPPPSPAPIRVGTHATRTFTSTITGENGGGSNSANGLLEEPKTGMLSTSYPPPRTSLSFAPAEENPDALQEELASPPSPLRPLVSFDQHFSNQGRNKLQRDSTPRKVVTGFQPLAAKRLSKPGQPNTSGSSTPVDAPPVPTSGLIPTHTSTTTSSSFSSAIGPPNAFAGRRRVYRNSTGSMANMTLQEQQQFQQLQREQLQKIQQNQANAGYETTAAMKINPRPRANLYPKRGEYEGPALGGLRGAGVPSHLGAPPLMAHAMGGHSGMDHGYDGQTVVGGKRESYSSRRQSMAQAMGKRPGAAPAAIQEEEE